MRRRLWTLADVATRMLKRPASREQNAPAINEGACNIKPVCPFVIVRDLRHRKHKNSENFVSRSKTHRAFTNRFGNFDYAFIAWISC